MNSPKIPIVVVAYNRLESLSRLLDSLDRSQLPGRVRLIISIDGGGSKDVIDFAEGFQWQHGDKELIQRTENLGLKAHILECGRLTNQYDGIVLLEDDLYVSPFFYEYALKAQSRYADEPRVSGVALYSPHYNETACLPFMPLEDGYDVFFVQLACSWGQCWSRAQWVEFEKWYEQNRDIRIEEDREVPPDVRLWPESSWKKYFIKYNVANGKFFVYPRASYSTNFGDSGVNHAGTSMWQVPLAMGLQEPRFPRLSESIAKYDARCEILPDSIKKFVPELESYDFTVDLYGVLDADSVRSEFILTRNPVANPLFTYGCDIKPHELNVIEKRPGNQLSFGLSADRSVRGSFLGNRFQVFGDYKKVQPYYYQITAHHYHKLEADLRAKWLQEAQLAKTSGKLVPALSDEAQGSSNMSANHAKMNIDLDEAGRAYPLRYPAEALIDNENLSTLERTQEGTFYCWTSDNPETTFVFSLDRSSALEMGIFIIALIKRNFLRKMQISIDGQVIRHRWKRANGLHVARCNLPPTANSGTTSVVIKLPGTYSPQELYGRPDCRKLGIAISEIRFDRV